METLEIVSNLESYMEARTDVMNQLKGRHLVKIYCLSYTPKAYKFHVILL